MVLWMVLGLAAGAAHSAAPTADDEAPLVEQVEIQNGPPVPPGIGRP